MNKINFRKRKLEEKSISIFEIFILVISIFAFAYFIAGEFKLVSAFEAGAAAEPVAPTTVPEVFSGAPAAPAAATVPTDTLTLSTTPVAAETALPAGASIGPAGELVTGGAATPPAAAAAKTPLTWSKFFGSLTANVWNIVGNGLIAAALYVGIRLIFEWSGICPTCDPELAQAWATALAIGYGAGAGIFYIVNALFQGGASFLGGLYGGLIGLAIAFLYMVFIYKQHYIVAVQYNCYPWKPDTGGSDCGLCNGRDFPCTEYKCQSLGQSCVLLNPGKKTEACDWENRNDPTAPTISAWNEALTEGYTYIPLTTQTGDRGVEIKNTNTADGCVPPFTRLDYGIQLNKPGQCRIDFFRKNSFNEMTIPGLISGGDSLIEHSLFSNHGGVDAANASGIQLPNGGKYQIFVRCMGTNGVANTGTFVLQYCVSMQADTTAPVIKLTDLPNGAPIQFGQTSRKVDVYVDKPSDCKWDHNDVDYDLMANKMSCSQTQGSNTYFKCTGNLTGLKDEVENKFYFNCKSYPSKEGTDKQSERATMATNYPYRLIGTRPLVIDSVSPESGTIIKDSTVSVKVTLKAITSAGYNDGAAKCWYKKKADAENKYNLFANPGTYSYQNTQELWFSRGFNIYTIKCCDLGGNCANQETSFTVDTDFLPPIVTRAYNEGDSLKIITGESSECVYDTTSCSYKFDDGIKMTSSDKIAHTTRWDTKSNFYIKCRDEFGNQPSPDGCSITVRPFNIY